MSRPDFSQLLAHFTTNRKPWSDSIDNPANEFINLSAYDRLISILKTRKIKASSMPWTGNKSVCLTECPWTSLLSHSERYSPYAIGFSKPRIFAAGGGPTFYVRADLWEKQEWDEHLKTFVTPFWPEYRPPRLKSDKYLDGKTIDYSHEREWRVPHDFSFQYSQIEFVILANYEDMAKFPKELKDSIGRDKFILMDQYIKIETLWPIHNIKR